MLVFPFTIFQYKQINTLCLTVNHPETSLLIVFDAIDEHISIAHFFSPIKGSFQRTVIFIIVIDQFTILELI